MSGRMWRCADCGWRWPLASVPYQDSECDACGGEMAPEDYDDSRDTPSYTPLGVLDL